MGIGDGALIFSLAMMLVFSLWTSANIPKDAQVPIHWGISGKPDRFASRTVALLLIPALSAATFGFVWYIFHISAANKTQDFLEYAKCGVATLFFIIHAVYLRLVSRR